MEKEIATHSSILAWRIPGTKESDGLPSLGLHRVGHDCCNLVAAEARIIESTIRWGTYMLKQWNIQFSSVTQSCPTLCNSMNHRTPGLPVHHQYPEFTQTHVHQVGDTIQPSHSLSSPSPPAPNPSQDLGRKVMTNLDSTLKSRDMTLPTKVRPVKAMVLPVVVQLSFTARLILF